MKIIKKEFNFKSSYWIDDAIYNQIYLQTQQRLFSDLYRRRGYLFLSDIYQVLGIEITQESCILGWHKDGETENEGFFGFCPIPETNNYELVFNCYPIIKYFDKEK